jgi:hypothetical protein
MVGFPFFRRRHQTSVTAVSEEVERQPLQRNSSVHKTKHGKSGRGIWSLAIELLAAVAIRLAQRHDRMSRHRKSLRQRNLIQRASRHSSKTRHASGWKINALNWAQRSPSSTTKLYDRTENEVRLSETERIQLRRLMPTCVPGPDIALHPDLHCWPSGGVQISVRNQTTTYRPREIAKAKFDISGLSKSR